MFTSRLRFLGVALAPVLLLASVSAADQINKGDIPEICVDCDGVALKYGNVSGWPGNTVSVPVYYTSADTLTYLQIWGTLPAGLTYDSYDTAGTPWSGVIIDTSTSGTIEIHLGRGGTLPPDTMARVLDVILDISDSSSFDTSFTIKFGHNVAAQIKGDLFDCDVIDTTWGTVTIPNDTVVVTLDSVTAYSYQAADTTDQAKIDNPLKVPVKLHTNFPLGSYQIWLQLPDSLGLVGFDSLGAGAQIEAVDDFIYLIYGTPASKPGNDSTYYLCDLKLKVGNYKNGYNGDQNFHESLLISVTRSSGSADTYVYCWGASDSVCYDSISMTTEGVYLPEYEISLDIKDAVIDQSGEVEVPVTVTPSFWAQFNNLYVGYDIRHLEYTGIDSVGGHIPRIKYDVVKDTIGNFEVRHYWTDEPDSGHYILPEVEQTIFKMNFTATDSFPAEGTTPIKFYEEDWTPPNMFYDFFSLDGGTNKIARDENDTLVWSTSDGTVSNPPQCNIVVGGPCYYENEVVRLEVDLDYVNVPDIAYFQLAYPDETPLADSITEGDWIFGEGIDIKDEGEYTMLILPLKGDIDSSGVLVYVWVTSEAGEFYIQEEDSWAGLGPKDPIIDITFIGDPVAYEWHEPKLTTELPGTFTLSQNYPNPFNARTNISFNMAKAGLAELVIYDILGRQMKTLVSEELPAGKQIVDWDGTNTNGNQIAGGVYFYVLKTGDFRESKKMLYLK